MPIARQAVEARSMALAVSFVRSLSIAVADTFDPISILRPWPVDVGALDEAEGR